MPYPEVTRRALKHLKQKRAPTVASRSPLIAVRASDGAHVLRLRALGALRDVELDLLVLVEGLVAL